MIFAENLEFSDTSQEFRTCNSNNKCNLRHKYKRGRGSRISKQSTHDGGNIDTTTHRPPLPPRKCRPIIKCDKLLQVEVIM